MEISLTEEKYSLIKNSLLGFNLKTIHAHWAGIGGLEFEFEPEIIYLEIRNNLKQTLSEIIEVAGINWNLNIEIVSSTDSETLLKFTEIRNLSDIGDVTFDNSDFFSADVYNYILNNYDLKIDECECVISHSQIGNFEGEKTSDEFYSTGGEFTSNGSFSFIVFNDDEETDVSDDELEGIICRVVHNYILNYCSMDLSCFDYNFDFIDGQLEDISLTLSPTTILIKNLN
ncbi:hypothetical protein [Aquirufa antheringensis]|uniref:hypothetical protein n=1 Tax=Aquirufa antheringensis TaxID=2516559 RepID=UPI0022A93A04|nr:hypothetical protein [Aquirufa antheringensis]MCZ2489277.1 hypothetical protein [Aquirufa antheringensis]